MDKNKNKNKTNVLRSSRSIKMKEISGNLAKKQAYLTLLSTKKNTSTSQSGLTTIQEAQQLLQKLLKLQDSDLRFLVDILKKTAKSIEGSELKYFLNENLAIVNNLKKPTFEIKEIKKYLENDLNSYLKKLKENLLKIAPTNGEGDVLKKLNDELSRPLSVETVEIQRNFLLLTYYFSIMVVID
jgi:hypothetical protein